MVVLLGYLAAGLLAWWGFLFFTQRGMLFPAPSAAEASPPAGTERAWIGPGESVEAWLLRPTSARAGPAPLLIYLHGNGELIDYWPEEFAAARARGLAVLLVEYPGYGRSAGAPSEASIREATLAAYDWAVVQPGIDQERVVAHGRSLGGGAAAILATERPVRALVLESSFSSVRAFARGYGAPGFLVRDPFDTESRLASYSGPVLLLHGARDESIPVAHAHRLHAALPRASLELLPCGHNDCPSSWPMVERFLEQERLLEAP